MPHQCKPAEKEEDNMFVISSLFELPPSNIALVRQVYIYAIKKLVESVRAENCAACKENLPLHDPEHDLGCYRDFEEALQKYFHLILADDDAVLEAMVRHILKNISDKLPAEAREGLSYFTPGQDIDICPGMDEVAQWRKELADNIEVITAADNHWF